MELRGILTVSVVRGVAGAGNCKRTPSGTDALYFLSRVLSNRSCPKIKRTFENLEVGTFLVLPQRRGVLPQRRGHGSTPKKGALSSPSR